MITCKTCHKFAGLDSVLINGMDEVILVGWCGHCKFDERPLAAKLVEEKMSFTKIPRPGNIDFDDWDELGIDR